MYMFPSAVFCFLSSRMTDEFTALPHQRDPIICPPNKVRRSQFGRGIIIAEPLHSELFGLPRDGGANSGSGGGGGVGAASAAADAATFRAACSRLALAIMNCWNFRFFAA